MNNIFVYIEMEGGKVADVSLELLTKGRELATTLGVKLEAVVLGHNLAGIEKELAKYGTDTVWVADDQLFSPFRTSLSAISLPTNIVPNTATITTIL
mgnify:CR=1 FL=1